jgi:anti-sigma factor RsiW
MTCREAEPLIHARLDRELDVAGSISIDHHLSECRACAAHYGALESLHDEIVAAELAYAPAPVFEQRLAEQFLRKKKSAFCFWNRPFSSKPLRSKSLWSKSLWSKSLWSKSLWSKSWTNAYAMAGAAIGIAILIFSFSLARTTVETDAIGVEILDNHLRALQPSHLVDVPSSDQHTVKPWFQGKTDFSPPVPDLTKDDFILIGGRLEVIHQQPAAAIVYRRRQHLIDLYVSPLAAADSKTELRELGGYHLLRWTQNNLNYWAVSDVDPNDLRMFADLIRRR